MQALSQLSYTPTGPSHITQMTHDGNKLAEWTGLEPATPGVTGRYSNQLNYHSWQAAFACSNVFTSHKPSATTWRPYGDSNPGTHRERVMS